MSPHPNATIERLLMACAYRQLSQLALARASGLSAVTLGKWRGSKAKPTRSNLGKVARALDIPLPWLLYGEGPDPFAVQP